MKRRYASAWRTWQLVASLAIFDAISGCGLKGALALPEKSGNVVVREHPATTGSSTASEPSGAATTPETPTAEPAAPPLPEKMPPPELPRSNSGTSR